MKNQDIIDQILCQSGLTTTLHLAHEGGDDFYFQQGDYERTDGKKFEEFLEREELILSSRERELIIKGLRQEKLVDNELTDSELLTLEIDVRSLGLGISRSEALEYMMDDYCNRW